MAMHKIGGLRDRDDHLTLRLRGPVIKLPLNVIRENDPDSRSINNHESMTSEERYQNKAGIRGLFRIENVYFLLKGVYSAT